MLRPRFVFVWLTAWRVWAGQPAGIVNSVAVPGTGLAVKLATQVGQPYDAGAIEKDVRYLWGLGRFEDIRVQASDGADGVAVVFLATPAERMRLHEIRIEPSTFGLEIKAPEGSPIDQRIAQQIATRARKQLEGQGYASARVGYAVVPHGNEVDLKLKVDAGEPVRVKEVAFAGDTGLAPGELRGALQALRERRVLPGIPHIWGGWKWLPSYSRGAVEADAARLQSLYLAKRYFDATVEAHEAEVHGSEARVTLEMHAGTRYNSPAPSCPALFAERRAAERLGILDFTAKMNIRETAPGAAEVASAMERGPAYRVGRIEFTGNRHFPDAAIRRNLALDEGAPLDERLLRRSLARLNRTGWFENLDERNVAILRDEKAGVADIRLRMVERKAGKWSLSGPAGPASLAGPLTASVSLRLPAWGRGLLELSTYTVSASAYAFARPILPGLSAVPNNGVPVLALQRLFTPGGGWFSGFTVAPQIGWRGEAFHYGTTQLEQRLLPWLAGDSGLVPELPVVVDRPAGEAVMMCAPPRLSLLRRGAGVAIGLLAAVTGL